MPFSVVVGAGPVGRATAGLLADSGQQVRLVSRGGRGPEHDRIVASLLSAAGRSGADYVMLGNTYGYGPVDGPMTEDLPMAPTTVKGRVRARMWTDALDAHERGRVRVVEVRASDYIGAGAVSGYTLMVVPAVLDGAEAFYPGDLDAAKSWNQVGDVARTLVAASRGGEWGRAWHVPPVTTRSVRAPTRRLADLAAAPEPALTAMSVGELRQLGESDTIIAELVEMFYLNDRPHVLDSAQTEARLGVGATPTDQALCETVTGAGCRTSPAGRER